MLNLYFFPLGIQSRLHSQVRPTAAELKQNCSRTRPIDPAAAYIQPQKSFRKDGDLSELTELKPGQTGWIKERVPANRN